MSQKMRFALLGLEMNLCNLEFVVSASPVRLTFACKISEVALVREDDLEIDLDILAAFSCHAGHMFSTSSLSGAEMSRCPGVLLADGMVRLLSESWSEWADIKSSTPRWREELPLWNGKPMLFTGDALFIGDVGRPVPPLPTNGTVNNWLLIRGDASATT
mmetsp:Transcript_79275/g.230216  ORF Transcript_79275/g.230216 Transcript_79275/m.230216 type:complete len:160 (-) Transcript_79275:285-764(-)